MGKNNYSDEVLNKCYKEYKDGKSITKICEERKLNRHTLSKKLKEKYQDINPSEKRNYLTLEQCSKHRKYKVDSDYFNNIDSENKAYWLGFLYADGYISKNKHILELGLKESDKNHIEKFAKDLKTDYPISLRKVKIKEREYKSYRICICSTNMNKTLEKLGCYNNKSKTINYPNFIIGHKFEKDFIRGYFDGDGSLSVDKHKYIKIGFYSGCYEFLEQLQIRIKELCGVELYIRKDKTCYALCISKRKEVEKFLNFIYENSNIYLDRKFERYIKFCVLPSQP